MKLLLSVVIGLVARFSHTAIAQTTPIDHAAPDTTAITSEVYWTIGKGAPVTICEVLPVYNKRSKKDSLQRFIQEHLERPAIAGPLDVDGRVFVSFIVGTDGQVYQARVRRGIHPLFDAEVLRVVQLLDGRFSPAICGGVARAHEVVVPVSFFRNSVSH